MVRTEKGYKVEYTDTSVNYKRPVVLVYYCKDFPKGQDLNAIWNEEYHVTYRDMIKEVAMNRHQYSYQTRLLRAE